MLKDPKFAAAFNWQIPFDLLHFLVFLSALSVLVATNLVAKKPATL